MDAIINLGSPLKDIGEIACRVMPHHVQTSLKITGARVFSYGNLLLTSPLYGAGMVQDCLEELWNGDLLRHDSRMILVGSMGSLTNDISLGTAVLPNPSLCAYYGFQGRELYQDGALMSSLAGKAQERGHEATVYRHGSSFAVFDPHTDHHAYKSSLYDENVRGLDCGEVFIGMEFARTKGSRAAAILYCSDTPRYHIAAIEAQEFARRGAEFQVILNMMAADVLRTNV